MRPILGSDQEKQSKQGFVLQFGEIFCVCVFNLIFFIFATSLNLQDLSSQPGLSLGPCSESAVLTPGPPGFNSCFLRRRFSRPLELFFSRHKGTHTYKRRFPFYKREWKCLLQKHNFYSVFRASPVSAVFFQKNPYAEEASSAALRWG